MYQVPSRRSMEVSFGNKEKVMMKVNSLYQGIVSSLIANAPKAKDYALSARLGLMVSPIIASGPALAQGFIRGLSNLNTLGQLLVGFITLIGLVAGLGMVLGGLFSAYKKFDRGNDEVTWAKISIQIGAGGLAMALGWVGINVVETMGGSSSDIGRSVR
jgi:hypothetical protein